MAFKLSWMRQTVALASSMIDTKDNLISWLNPIERCAAVDVSYAASQAHRIVNVPLHQDYPSGIVFIFFQGRKDLYHV
jgi:hypothetical protein